MLEKTVDGKYTLIGLEEKGDAFQSHLAHYHLLGTQVVVDLIYPGRLERGPADLISRLGPLPTLRHPAVSRVFAWGEEEEYLFVVREFAHGTLLADLLRESGGLPPRQALEVARRLAEGLGALYGRGLFYAGLNPHQVQLDRKGEAGIIRPGYSFLLEREDRRLSREAAPYWAPEVISGGEGTRASDTYSLGMMVLRMLGSWEEDEALAQALRAASSHDPPAARSPASCGAYGCPRGSRPGPSARPPRGRPGSIRPAPSPPRPSPGSVCSSWLGPLSAGPAEAGAAGAAGGGRARSSRPWRWRRRRWRPFWRCTSCGRPPATRRGSGPSRPRRRRRRRRSPGWSCPTCAGWSRPRRGACCRRWASRSSWYRSPPT